MSRRGALTVEVTVSSFSSYVAFLEGYARALVAAETRWDRARTWLQRRDPLGPRRGPLRARRTSPLGAARRSSFPAVRTDRDVSRLAQEVFALPGPAGRGARRARSSSRSTSSRRSPASTAASVEHALRAAVQHQREVGYVFAGSEPSLMERMLGPKRPFYKAGPVMRLEKIPADEFAAFIDARFTRSGIRPEPGLGAAIVDLAGNLPYDVQRLAHETWDEVRAGRPSARVDARRSAPRAAAAARRAADDVRGASGSG